VEGGGQDSAENVEVEALGINLKKLPARHRADARAAGGAAELVESITHPAIWRT
jgi:hypothetical protein